MELIDLVVFLNMDLACQGVLQCYARMYMYMYMHMFMFAHTNMSAVLRIFQLCV